MVHKFPYIYSINQEALEEVVTHYWTPSKPLCHLAGFLGQSRPQKSKQDVKHAELRCRGGAADHCGILLRAVVSPLPQVPLLGASTFLPVCGDWGGRLASFTESPASCRLASPRAGALARSPCRDARVESDSSAF